jgi:hypothetical protein
MWVMGTGYRARLRGRARASAEHGPPLARAVADAGVMALAVAACGTIRAGAHERPPPAGRLCHGPAHYGK